MPKKRQEFGVNELNQLTWVKPNPHEVEGFASRPAAVEVNGQLVVSDGSEGFETTVSAAAGETTPLTIRAIAPDGTVTEEKKHILNQQEFRYDENGNLIQDAERLYIWDAENRLAKVVWLSARPQNQPTVVEMEYDGEGRRVRIVAKHGDMVLSDKRFVWCDGVQPCEERDTDGNVVKRFYEHGFQVVNETQTENFYYTKDHLGSVREVTDSLSVVRARYDYDPWGRRTKLSGDVAADFGFTGFYHDTASGLDLTWYRAYSPELGRWLSRDPLGEFDGGNIYSYVHNSPIIHIDDIGLYCGTSSSDRWIPDAPLGFDFSSACQKHDVCYGTCGKKKSECDVLFLVEMKLICRNNYGNSGACLKMADTYYRAVVSLGDTAYREAQEQACRDKKCK